MLVFQVVFEIMLYLYTCTVRTYVPLVRTYTVYHGMPVMWWPVSTSQRTVTLQLPYRYDNAMVPIWYVRTRMRTGQLHQQRIPQIQRDRRGHIPIVHSGRLYQVGCYARGYTWRHHRCVLQYQGVATLGAAVPARWGGTCGDLQ